MTRKQIVWIVAIAFFVGGVGSIFFNRVLIPNLSTVKGLGWVGQLQSSAPIVISRREEVRLNEGVNLIELTKQAQTVVVSVYSSGNDQKFLGNGLIITSDGIIFTAKDVVGPAQTVRVVTNDGSVFPGQVRALDPKSPLAVVTIQARDLPVAQFSDAASMQTAQRVFSLGRTNQEFTREFTSGLITKNLSNQLDPERVLSTEIFENTIATDADIDGSYMGGPVVNLQGLIVGIIAGTSGQILPAEAVDGALRSYLETGKIQRPHIGMTYQMVSKTVAKLKNLNVGGGLVAATEAGSPAAKAGLLPGDLITQVNGQNVADSTLEQLLVAQGSNQMKLSVARGGQQMELTLTPILK